MIRKWHRWVSLPLILVLALAIVTDIALQVEELDHIGGEGRPAPTMSALPEDAVVLAELKRALVAARQADPNFAAQRIELNYAEDKPVAKFVITPRGGASVEVDLASGIAQAKAAPTSFHGVMIRLHTGQYFGATGIILIMAAGVALLFLAVSGGLLYFQMWRNRRSRGKSLIFWH
jgi:uncharacterized iron-regulated membrane protein